jgi:hypothetical protein
MKHGHVGVAQACARHLHEYLVRPDLGYWDVSELEHMRSEKLKCTHALAFRSVRELAAEDSGAPELVRNSGGGRDLVPCI